MLPISVPTAIAVTPGPSGFALKAPCEEQERKFYFQWLRSYLRSQGVKDRAVWKAVQRKGWMYRFPLPTSTTRLLRRAAGRLSR